MMTSHRIPVFPVPWRRMAGLSLVELMIGIVLGLIILAGIVAVFANTSRARNEIERSGRQIENGRYAVGILTDDLRVAGFYGELNAGEFATPTALPDPCSTSPAVWNDPATNPLRLHLQGYDNGTGAPACLPASVKANTDIVVVRRVLTCVAGVSGCGAATSGMPYFQGSLCSTEVTKYVLGLKDTAPFDRTLRNCATPAGLRQYVVRIYFISTDNGTVPAPVCPNPDPKINREVCVPTLKRLDLDPTVPAGWTETPLVEGVESLNIEYGIDYKDGVGPYAIGALDSDRDGIPDAYTTDPTNFLPGDCPTTCTSIQNWRNAVTAHFYILVRNTDASPGHTDTKTYNLGNDAAGNAIVLGPFNDGFRRHVYSGLVRINNPAGRRDTP